MILENRKRGLGETGRNILHFSEAQEGQRCGPSFLVIDGPTIAEFSYSFEMSSSIKIKSRTELKRVGAVTLFAKLKCSLNATTEKSLKSPPKMMCRFASTFNFS